MTALESDDTREAGEWGVFVARAVQEIRRELGEDAANRVATSLHNLKNEAIDATRERMQAAEAVLARSLDEVDEARRAHERLQADLARMNAALRNAKVEASRVLSEAADQAARRKAELDALADAEAARIAAAWDELRQHEADLAARRAELLTAEEKAAARFEALDAMASEIEGERVAVAADREAALVAVEAELEARAESKVAEVIDLREGEIDLREKAVVERAAELDEWEADLIARAEQLERREAVFAPTPPPVGGNVSGWGRRRPER